MQRFIISAILLISFITSMAQFPVGTTSVRQFPIQAQWKFKQADKPDSTYMNAIVPGCVHKDLMANTVIADPFIGTNEKDCQWVGEKNWIYRTEPFNVEESVLKNEIVRIKFNGLDTYATVKINGQKVLYADNAHRSWEIDAKPFLKTTGNIIEITFESPIPIGEQKLKSLPYPLPGEGLRAVTRKPQFHFGWDWGPKLITCGVSKPIEIIAYDYAKFNDIYVEQKSVTQENAKLLVKFVIHSTKDGNAMAMFEMPSTGDTYTTDITLKKGMNLVELPLDIPYPNLWWCNGQGKSSMYEFNVWLLKDETVLDSKVIRTGLRTIDLVTEKDSIGESFSFKLNNRSVFMKGANYIPISYFPAQAKELDYRKMLQQCKDANINMLRVWGGGVYEEEIFYKLCDEMGIMVWQDFMFACSMYPADSLFVTNVMAEAEEQTIRLRNHPCMALWCGNNENAEGWERWGWQMNLTPKQQGQVWRAYKDVFDLTLPKYVKNNTNLDYWESSPRYGRGDARSITEGDSHYWGVWHDEEPFEIMNNKVPRFMSEYGMQSFPSTEVWKQMLVQPNSPSYSDPGFLQHQKHNRGFKLMDKYMINWYPGVTHDSLQKYAYMTQVVQAEGIGLGIEAHRRNMPRCMGTLYWQLNDVWPSFSWAGMDYKGQPKLLHTLLKVLYAPQLISTVVENGVVKIYWISDNNKVSEKAQMTYEIVDENGKVLYTSASKEVQLDMGSYVIDEFKASQVLGKVDLKNKIIRVHIEGSQHWYRESKLSYESTVFLVPEIQKKDFTSKDGKKTRQDVLIYKKING